MLIANLPTELRRAIGLVAAYVLALQTILGSVAPRLAVAFDTTLPFDLAAICLSSHGAGVGPAADIPGGSGNGSQAGRSLCPVHFVRAAAPRTAGGHSDRN